MKNLLSNKATTSNKLGSFLLLPLVLLLVFASCSKEPAEEMLGTEVHWSQGDLEETISAKVKQCAPCQCSFDANLHCQTAVHTGPGNGALSEWKNDCVITICEGEKALLRVNNGPQSVNKNLNYEWCTDGKGHQGNAPYKWATTQAGIYTAQVTDENGCCTVLTFEVIVVDCECCSLSFDGYFPVDDNYKYQVRLNRMNRDGYTIRRKITRNGMPPTYPHPSTMETDLECSAGYYVHHLQLPPTDEVLLEYWLLDENGDECAYFSKVLPE